jgi:multidrug efflux system outer membrane protein
MARTPADLSGTGQPVVGRSYKVGGISSYELDLFGRVHSLDEQALQQFLASAETRKAAQISLVAEVANAWLTLQSDHALRKLTVDTLASQQESLKIVQVGFANETASVLGVAQAETSVRQAEANLAQYDRQIKQDINALTLIVGKPIDADLLMPVSIEKTALTTDLPAGLPSDLLTRRPDIMAAEHRLMAANANIGAARAAFFPRISLTAAGNTASASLSGLFDGGSAAWSFVPVISVPIFDYGRNQANLDVANIGKDIEIANYQKAIQTAFREVSDTLGSIETYERQKAAQLGLVDSSSRAYTLSQKRYREGVDSYLNVLVNQRALYSAQENFIRLQLAQASNAVAFYRSLGGGWKA